MGDGAVDVAQLVEAEQADAEGPEIGRSSHCSGTPAAVCRPRSMNFLPDWISASSV